MAAEAGVSIKTASNVVNKRAEHCSAETCERVTQAAVRLGYMPNLAARHLRRILGGGHALAVDGLLLDAVAAADQVRRRAPRYFTLLRRNPTSHSTNSTVAAVGHTQFRSPGPPAPVRGEVRRMRTSL